MPAFKSLRFLALAGVAIVALSSGPTPVNALGADRALVARYAHAHNPIARRRRRDSSGTCSSPSSDVLSYTPPPSTTPTPTPTEVQTTPSSAAPAPTSGSSKKWGLAWSNGDTGLSSFALPNVGYLYTWSPELPDNIPNGIEGIPMCWGWDQVDTFQQKVVAGYAHKVLGPNEPNQPGQSNMSPSDAMNLWMTYINPLKDQGYYLISPACTDDDDGLQWYNEFIGLCSSTSGCQVDAIAFHAYTTDAQYTIAYANWLHGNYSRPIWLTEFADQNFSGGPQATMDEIWDYAGEIVQFASNTDWMEGIFPFGAMNNLDGVNPDNSLMSSDGSPNDLAYYYFG